MAHSFCRNLSNSYRFIQNKNELNYQPCCWVPTQSVNDNQSLREARASITSQIEANPRKFCSECLDREKYNYTRSDRQKANNFVPDDAVDGDPYILEFQIDTTCNAACIICGPELSSLWQRQKKIIPISNDDVQRMQTQMMLMLNFDKVTNIKFFGGEPLYTKVHLDIIERVPDPSKVTLTYATNGSIYPKDRVLDLWTKFKQVIISTSIDGTGAQFEYIRWPLPWKKVEENVVNFYKIPKVDLWNNYTVNCLNALYVNEFEDWLGEIYQSTGTVVGRKYSRAYGTYALNKMPLKLYERCLEMYPDKHPVKSLLEANKPSNNPDDIVRVLTDLEYLDNQRGLNWQETFSQVAHHFK